MKEDDKNHVVQLPFEDFNVESHSNSSYDHVAVYDVATMTVTCPAPA